MTVFSAKLARLAETIAMVGECGTADLAAAIALGRDRPAIAVASGGSVVAAEYFCRCRATLGLGPTVALTPMQFVLSPRPGRDDDVWLFSAGADNPDVAAAFRSALASGDRPTRLVTARRDGRTALAAGGSSGAELSILPVADPKDGFLATHSMMAMVAALLFASDAATERPVGRALVDDLSAAARSLADDAAPGPAAGFMAGDVVFVLHDPQLAAAAVLIETFLWEAGIAPVQRTDLRNFAHGRHVWAAKHPGTMFILALTTRESEAVWRPIADALPPRVRRGEIRCGHGGRMANAVAIIEALRVVARCGEAAGIDPGRPGHGPFADAIYRNPALEDLATDGAAVRHKTSACLLHDTTIDGGASLGALGRGRIAHLGAVEFAGVALDYDGTMVPGLPEEDRLGPVPAEVASEVVRLVDAGVRIGVATGRGGSAGERLREALPERVHRLVLVGYYNGAHLRTLDVDIRSDPPAEDPRMPAIADWLVASGLLRAGARPTASRTQVAVLRASIVDVESFAQALASCPEVAAGGIGIVGSHHSFDLVPEGTSKLRVVDALSAGSGRIRAAILAIGDSGSRSGNDHELLRGPDGVSVDSVCGDPAGVWTLFGDARRGPEALVAILRAARCRRGSLRLDVDALGLEPRQ